MIVASISAIQWGTPSVGIIEAAKTREKADMKEREEETVTVKYPVLCSIVDQR